MPVVFRHAGLTVSFYSNEGQPREPMHVHVRRGGSEVKLWLEPNVAIARTRGFNARVLSEIVTLVSSRREEIERAWHGHFGD